MLRSEQACSACLWDESTHLSLLTANTVDCSIIRAEASQRPATTRRQRRPSHLHPYRNLFDNCPTRSLLRSSMMVKSNFSQLLMFHIQLSLYRYAYFLAFADFEFRLHLIQLDVVLAA
jgi:hypothetical protein